MDDKRRIKVSKYLSRHLRHEPERLGLKLEPGGWVGVDDLLKACAHHRFMISRAELEIVVATSDKQRFAFDPTGTRVRANQGHSVPIDLQLEAIEPPAVLYHGTGEKSVAAILQDGLCRMKRHHVHLSADLQTAFKVGARHGRPAILAIDAARMHRGGHLFFRSANGVWLVEAVPTEFLRLLEPAEFPT